MNKTPETAAMPGGLAIFIQTRRRLTKEQLVQALGSMADDDPRWLALHQVIDEALAAAVLDSADPRLEPGKGTYAGGRTAALAELKKRLVDLRASPAAAKLAGRRKP